MSIYRRLPLCTAAALILAVITYAAYAPRLAAQSAEVMVIVNCVYYSPTASGPFKAEVKGIDVSGRDDGPVPPGTACSDMASRLAMLGFTILNSTSVTGDYNADGTVDAADYVIWRKNLGPVPTATELSGR